MRKENSKYVERDGPISGCDSDLAGPIKGVGGPYDASDECGPGSRPMGAPGVYATFNECCNANPRKQNCLEACEECPEQVAAAGNATYCGSSGGSTEDCSAGAHVSTSLGMVTCCETPMGVGACAKANGMSGDLANELCAAFDTLSHSCIAIPGGESAKDRPGCRTQTIPVMGPDGMSGKPVKMEPDTYLNSSLNCKNAQDPEQCAVEGALQYFKACRKGSAGPPHGHHGGHRGGKKGKKPNPPSPGPSPNPSGQGSNKGGMAGGEIAGIVVGSVAGAILLLLAVGALLRGSGKKGKKK